VTTRSQQSSGITMASAPSGYRRTRSRRQGLRLVEAATPAAVVAPDPAAFDRWTIQQKRAHLAILSTRLWDIEDELARTRTARASLMTSLQGDLRHAD
jgi:hypothetical protein